RRARRIASRRTNMAAHKVCVLGGSGFIGREVVARLGALGHEVKVLTRNPAQHRELTVLPSMRLVRANVHDEATLVREFAGCDVVINLVGILNERALGRGSGAEFRRVHTELPQKVVRACKAAGVQRYLHMSGLKADSKRGPSHYLRTKGAAEDYIREHCADGRPQYVIFQPSVVFGPGDAFINNFAGILKLTPGVLPLACAEAKFAPVYVGDVADAFVGCLDRRDVVGRTYELCGPDVMTLGEIVRETARVLGLRRLVIPLPAGVSRVQAAVMDFVPGKPFSTDNFLSATLDSTCAHDGLGALGIERTPMRGTIDKYLRPK
ncbi:MAG TPA: complex I NDUFA9 subunit family protein, partial [Steroidobacteraceae bacterium]|nr:complex I NDUFA9 subunit family protein [Steroidobacteraceae bacterium]